MKTCVFLLNLDCERTERCCLDACYGTPLRFPTKAIRRNGIPVTSTMDGRDAHAAAIKGSHEAHGTAMVIRLGLEPYVSPVTL